jgi:shikimate dehydrogenase
MSHNGMAISAHTRIVGIIGDPVEHSLSPAMHNAAFRRLRMDWAYVAFHVRPADLAAAVAGLRALGVGGVNVTVPHKERVIELLDSVSATARRAGAVNTILNRHGHLHGENTDVAGFVEALHTAKFRLRGKRVLVMGAGGVARAVLTALAHGGVRAVTVANRTGRRATALAETFRTRKMPVRAVGLAGLLDGELLGAVDLVVNATSVGLRGEGFFPLAYTKSPKQCLFFDLIYGRRTAFLTAAARAGRPTLDGAGMLLHQGAAAFQMWTGCAAPLTVMRAALRRG